MKTILSYGGGVNSTAIIALAKIGEIPMPDYIVFSDTGAEYPHTYSYMNYLEDQGVKMIYLTGGTKFMGLVEFCQLKNIIPSRVNRWCTDHWKRTPVQRFSRAIGDATVLIGIDAGEEHRADKRRDRNTKFPLLDLNIDRNKCKEIIRRVGWGVPQKSGCYICPYQPKREWVKLKKEYPDLWDIAVNLEKNASAQNPLFTYHPHRNLEKFVGDLDKQSGLDFGIQLDQKCECCFD
jgi:hypothetical protein